MPERSNPRCGFAARRAPARPARWPTGAFLFARSFGPGQLGMFEAEIVALSLRSFNPVQIGDSFFDLRGIKILSHNDPGGGTFDSFFDVFVDAAITPVGGGDSRAIGPIPDRLTSEGLNNPWCHAPAPGYLGGVPSGGFFVRSTSGSRVKLARRARD